jgi:hypothetical protein
MFSQNIPQKNKEVEVKKRPDLYILQAGLNLVSRNGETLLQKIGGAVSRFGPISPFTANGNYGVDKDGE